MNRMNLCGLKRSRILTQIAVVMFTMANIGIVRVEVIGHDVRIYFS